MYKLLLILKYLRRKLAPMFAALAVTLCTMMVILVISVMGGFLDHLRTSIHRLAGDVAVTAQSLRGFPHYEDLVQRLEAEPTIDAATPMITSFGLLKVGEHSKPVQVFGIRPESYAAVTAYDESLYWTDETLAQREAEAGQRGIPDDWEELLRRTRRRLAQFDLRGMGMELWAPEPFVAGAAATRPGQAEGEAGAPGAVLGIAVSPTTQLDELGNYTLLGSPMRQPVTLTVVPLTEGGSLEGYGPSYERFVVVNEFKSGHYEVDSRAVFVPLEVLQRKLEMHEKQLPVYAGGWGEEGAVETVPARVTDVRVRGAEGASLAEIHAAAERVVRAFREEHPDVSPFLEAQTWEQQNRQILAAVANEKGLVTFLFAIISLVATVMVATTFYMIVLEKTRDIGVLRAVGASRAGIAGIFLGYGLAIGVVGSAVGFVLAWLISRYLNQIQWWLANRLGVTVVCVAAAVVVGLAAAALGWAVMRRRRWAGVAGVAGGVLGVGAALAWLALDPAQAAALNGAISIRLWDPQIYVFDRIPSRIDGMEAGVIVSGAIVFSMIGALLPALLAALQDPVEALRYE